MLRYISFLLLILFFSSCEDFFNLNKLNLLGEDTILSIEDTLAKVQGYVVDLNPKSGTVIQHGHCWSENNNPSLEDNKTELGERTQNGSYESTLTDLKPETIYFFRAYLRNEEGTVFGNVFSFKTLADSRLPVIATLGISNISQNTALAEGKAIQKGIYQILAFGHCWAKQNNPTTSDSKTDLGTNISNSTSFFSNLTGLTSQSTYFIRAYISYKNTETGESLTVYGNEITFRTA